MACRGLEAEAKIYRSIHQLLKFTLPRGGRIVKKWTFGQGSLAHHLASPCSYHRAGRNYTYGLDMEGFWLRDNFWIIAVTATIHSA